jgi:FMN phosphatase YigB (HAD superfamily)
MLQLFLDDNVRNVAAGKALGLRTALVNVPINPLVVKSKKKN